MTHTHLDVASVWHHSDAMNLRPYVENIHHELAATAEAGGDEAREVAERLMSPLDSTIRLTLLDVLTAAAGEITCDLAPGSVEVRLRGRDLGFVVTPPPVDPSADDVTHGDNEPPDHRPVTRIAPPAEGEADEGAMSRVNLRMPDHFKARVERAAANEGLSVNAWLVRAAASALERADPDRQPERRARQGAQRYTGWAR